MNDYCVSYSEKYGYTVTYTPAGHHGNISINNLSLLDAYNLIVNICLTKYFLCDMIYHNMNRTITPTFVKCQQEIVLHHSEGCKTLTEKCIDNIQNLIISAYYNPLQTYVTWNQCYTDYHTGESNMVDIEIVKEVMSYFTGEGFQVYLDGEIHIAWAPKTKKKHESYYDEDVAYLQDILNKSGHINSESFRIHKQLHLLKEMKRLFNNSKMQ